MAKVKKIDAEKSRREAFRLYEEVEEYFLSRALDGELYPTDYAAARAAFDMADVDALRELCDTYRTNVEFVEPNEALKAHLPKMKPLKLKNGKTRKFRMEDFTLADRSRILPDHPGTRAYARAQMEQAGGGTPFDD